MRTRLEAILGPGGVMAGAGGVLRAMPESNDDAAAVLALCTAEGWRVRAAGTGQRTRADSGSGAAVVLSTERLLGLTVYEPEDLTLGCRAGCRHGDLDGLAAKHRQLLPLDPATGHPATVGGTVALADAGPLRAGYGTPRDQALGITLVTGDGRVLRFGGRVVKNVAGYDVVRLLVGSRGTLGLITELHLRLRATPERDLTLLLALPDGIEAAALALTLRDATAPAALEILAPTAPETDWQVAVRLQGGAAAVEDARARIAGLAAPLELDTQEALTWWDALARRERSAPVQLRITVLPGRLAPLLAAFARTGMSAHALGCAHATEGILRLGLDVPELAGAEALAALLAEAVTLGGTWSYAPASMAPGELARATLPAPPARPERVVRLERELQARFDPGSILPEWGS